MYPLFVTAQAALLLKVFPAMLSSYLFFYRLAMHSGFWDRSFWVFSGTEQCYVNRKNQLVLRRKLFL